MAEVLLATLPLAGACKRTVPPDPQVRATPSAAASVAALPVDALEPGELQEGTEKVYGLTLPRSFKVVREFDGVAYCAGSGRPENVSNYIRRRVDARTVELGPARTVFPTVQVNGSTGKKLRIEVASGNGETELIIRDVTPPAIEPGLTEEERWKKAGLKPSGGLLNPDTTF